MEWSVAVGAVILVIVLAVTGRFGGSGTSSTTSDVAGTCTVPLVTPADVAACRGTWQLFDATEAGNGGRALYRIAIASSRSTDVVAALANAARDYRSSADEITIFGYSSMAAYETGAPFDRGRVTVGGDGQASFEICDPSGCSADGFTVRMP